MAAKQLFQYFFKSPLQRDTVQALRETTGMRIREVGNAWEDTPGRGRFASGASMYLTRLEPEGTWTIDAFTHTPDDLDIPAAAAMRSNLQRLLDRITDDWKEPYVAQHSWSRTRPKHRTQRKIPEGSLNALIRSED